MEEICFLPYIASQKILSSRESLLSSLKKNLEIESETERVVFYGELTQSQLKKLMMWLDLGGKKKPISFLKAQDF